LAFGIFLGLAELNRIAGELALHRSSPDQTAADRYFRKVIEVARAEKGRWWELRATMSLARLLRDTGRRDEARSMLAEMGVREQWNRKYT
jgi:hypothetical protein